VETAREMVKNLNFCVIDLETTGGNHERDQIIEIGMVKIRNFEVVESKGFLVNPERSIPEFIQKLTSIKEDDVKNAPTISEVIDEIIQFIGDDILVAHNTSFDIPFLNSVLKRLDYNQLENKVICTNVMTKYMIPEILNSNLNYMCHLFDIEHKQAHRAVEDAKASAELLIKYLEIFVQKDIKKVNQLYYPQNKFELDRIHLKEKEELKKKLADIKDYKSRFTFTFKGKNGLILGVFPSSDVHSDTDFILELAEELDWKTVTIKIIGPFLEGLFQFNNHYNKYPEEIRDKILAYLNKKYVSKKVDSNLKDLDFVFAPHLISEQVLVYSFLSLNTNLKPIFKYPGHKKKLVQYLKSQVNRFENNQKRRKKLLLHKELAPLVQITLENEEYLKVSLKSFKTSSDLLHEDVEDFIEKHLNTFSFPVEHL
jgi:DNA polymerase-3 subunit epsilon